VEGDAAERKPNRTNEIAGWIRGEIESGTFLPGARLEERSLCEHFGVSKTPVREALIQLSSVGLVELRQRRGATVSMMSVEQVISMFEVVIEMEGMAARLAADRMSTQSRELLSSIHADSEQFVTNADPDKYDAINKRFHELIYRGTGNEYLEANIKDMRSRLRLYRRYPFQRPDRIRQSFEDHGQIVDAIMKGDGDAASRIMEEHMTTGGRVFADLVAAMRQQT
jgi:DNA-binding GntR family transcriptional regulator